MDFAGEVKKWRLGYRLGYRLRNGEWAVGWAIA
jgi:hypothetical protein